MIVFLFSEMKVTPIDHHILVLKRFTCTMTIQNTAIDYVTIFRFNYVMLFSEYVLFPCFDLLSKHTFT